MPTADPMIAASIPSPTQGIWNLGPLPIRAYALCIIAGIVLALWVSERRWRARGGRPGLISDIAVWAIPFGIVGARLYHVITDPQIYFAEGRDPWRIFFIWEGGLGIWGAVALGAVGAYVGSRRHGVLLRDVADVVAPGLVLAQAVGRWGNWFNQELFGQPTDAPWGLQIDVDNRPQDYAQFSTFHPTFLYESIWNLALFAILVWAGKRFSLTGGRLFAVYVMGYTLGRAWIEYLRIDPVNHILGLRLNVWTSVILFAAGAVYFAVARNTTSLGQDGAASGEADVGDGPEGLIELERKPCTP